MIDFLFYLAAFALILGILVLVHEYGHYFVARLAGVKILRFSLGFGQPIFSICTGRDQTEWAIGAFPLGGYVKMLDEREGEVAPEEQHRAFNRKSVGWRMAIVAAGPVANLLLAFCLYWWGFWSGAEEVQPLLGTPVEASAAAAAGIKNGDLVRKIDEQSIQTWQEMTWHLMRRAASQNSVDLEVMDQHEKIQTRALNIASVSAEGWKNDALKNLGIRFYEPQNALIIGQLSADGAAAAAGLRVGDEIVRVDNEAVSQWKNLISLISAAPNKSLLIEFKRNDVIHQREIRPQSVGLDGRIVGRIGISNSLSMMTTVEYDVIPAFRRALIETYDKVSFNIVMIGKLLVGQVSWRNISGPVTIADYAGQSAKMGFSYYIKFMAVISIGLAVMNLLPIPILDGGHLLYYGIEIIRRKPLSDRSMEIAQKIGLFLLLLLMLCAFFNDFNRLISG